MSRTVWLYGILVGVCLGCDAPAEPSASAADPQRAASSGLERAPSASGGAATTTTAAPVVAAAPAVAALGTWGLEQTLKALAPGEEVLAAWEGGALLSKPHPEVPNADQAKLLDVRMVGERALRLAPELPLEDAARVWQGRLLAISVDRELLELDDAGQVKRVIEGPVQGPLSVSADGRHVAYMRGEAPELAPVVLDVATGAAREVAAQGFAWAPALSEDGRMVSFVEGGERGPQLVRASVDGAGREVLDARGHFPVGTRAPLWMGEVLVFEAEAGLMAWSPRGVWSLSGAMPVRVPGDQARVLVHHAGGAPSLLALDAKE